MRNPRDEIVPGDPAVLKNWLVFLGLYIAFLLWLEPMIDFLMTMLPLDRSLAAIDAFNQKKHYVATIAFGVARSLPILMFLWLGYVVMQAQRLPPKHIKLPFSVKLISGPRAKMIGMMMMSLALLLLLREVSMLVSVQPV
ncbi:MAG: hypothetical protein OEW58_13080 [Gammaproteobacteria bacterium]|nr:hypothetical protein [Gammaproteobacteria bacterium]